MIGNSLSLAPVGSTLVASIGHHLDRNAEQIARHDVHAVAQRDRRPRAVLGEIERDLRAGIAHADHQHRLAGERLGVGILRAVNDLALEFLDPGDGRRRRLGIVPGRDHDIAGADRSRGALDQPIIPVTPDRTHRFAEARPQIKMRGVTVEILDEEIARHVARIIVRERQERQRGKSFDRMQMQAFVVAAP